MACVIRYVKRLRRVLQIVIRVEIELVNQQKIMLIVLLIAQIVQTVEIDIVSLEKIIYLVHLIVRCVKDNLKSLFIKHDVRIIIFKMDIILI